MTKSSVTRKTPAHTRHHGLRLHQPSHNHKVGLIVFGQYDVVMVGGVGLVSHTSICHMSKVILDLNQAKDLDQQLTLICQFRLNFLSFELLAEAEFPTSETMSHTADQLAAACAVSLLEQDESSLGLHTGKEAKG